MEIVDIINEKLNVKIYRKFIVSLLGYEAFITKNCFTPTIQDNWSTYVGIFKKENKDYYISVNSSKSPNINILEDPTDENPLYSYSKNKFFSELEANKEIIKMIYYLVTSKKINEILDDIKLLNENDFIPVTKSRFILGAGVSKDYGSNSWKEMLKSLEEDKKDKIEFINDIADKLFNTSYAKPQILKDFDEEYYYNNFIYKNIYSDVKKYDIESNAKTTLSAVASVLIKQSNKNENTPIQVLTFNYDNYLSEYIKHRIKSDSFVIDSHYSMNNEEYINKHNINIAHVHGFYPKNKDYLIDAFKKDIILTNDDYLKAYKSAKKYTPFAVSTFLSESSILVGNSLTDYEEQKIFKRNFKKNIDTYHYILLCKEKDKDNESKYMQMYFLGMGCIPIWFDSFDEMTKFIERLE